MKLLVLLGVVVTEPRRCEEPALERSIQSNRDGITRHDGPLDASGIGGAKQQDSSRIPVSSMPRPDAGPVGALSR